MTEGARIADAVAGSSSRRGFLARVGAAVMGAAGVHSVGSLVAPGEAEAYHFCGHIYTTDSCPHPTGLPRIDAKGLPIRAADVPGSPFAVALGADGTVLAKGTFNTGAQLESVLAAAERRQGAVRA